MNWPKPPASIINTTHSVQWCDESDCWIVQALEGKPTYTQNCVEGEAASDDGDEVTDEGMEPQPILCYFDPNHGLATGYSKSRIPWCSECMLKTIRNEW